MSTTTERLGLIMPSINDEIHQTIVDLANNFQKISDSAEIYMDSYPTTGYWINSDRVWNLNPNIGEYAGWINIREGMAAPKWGSITPYEMGEFVVLNSDNGHYYKCIQSGFSGVTEPTFPTNLNGTVEDIKNSQTWQASTDFQLNDIVIPTFENNRFYVCTVAGTSGSSEPVWSTVDGGTVSDNGVVWTGYRIVVWEEQGTSSNFRPFGKID